MALFKTLFADCLKSNFAAQLFTLLGVVFALDTVTTGIVEFDTSGVETDGFTKDSKRLLGEFLEVVGDGCERLEFEF